MAELGVASAVIGLIETGFALGKFLHDTYNNYSSAPKEVLKISVEVTICCELMQPFGDQLQARAVSYTPEFVTSIKALVDNVSRSYILLESYKLSHTAQLAANTVTVERDLREHP